MFKRVSLGSLIVGFAYLLSVPLAYGATVIGSSLTTAPDSNGACGLPSCTVLQEAAPPLPLQSPIDGVVVSWTTLGGPGGTGNSGTRGSLKLVVLHPAGGAQFTRVRSGPLTSIPATGGEHPMITTAVSPGLAIGPGEYIALDEVTSSTTLARHFTGSTSYTFDFWAPPQPDGSTTAYSGTSTGAGEYLYQSRIEPDADHDGFGDETQDRCPTDPSTQGPCSVKKKCKHKKKHKRAAVIAKKCKKKHH